MLLNASQRTKEAMTTVTDEDIQAALETDKQKVFKFTIDEDVLNKALNKLNSLIGIENIKKEANEMVKIARFFSESGEDFKDSSNLILFFGNPGTGKQLLQNLVKIYQHLVFCLKDI